MSLFIASLNSGSNGNCYYVGNDQEAILVDAGISCRETERRMHRLGLSMQNVKAIFVSHEHTDHISGIPVLAKKYQLPVYITEATRYHGNLSIQQEQLFSFKAYEPVQIGNLAIQAFPKFHDAAEPHSFIVNGNNVNIGVFTDIGAACDHLIMHFKHCHAAFLEANYDEEMLEKGSYLRHLKNRIRGGHGHLSNKQALDIFTQHKPAYMSHLFLSHLSRDNNSPQLVQQLFNEHAGATQIIVASRFEETAVYHVQAAQGATPVSLPQKAFIEVKIKPSYTQLRLW
ncbi:MBL fold metallo-hydrolase [Niastella sp. OAS944]|uniref:MBL fold metallo-hydrolase n=1 Tax=Niastella sp. OAS944 TaxID=2664089 RepID=UPI003492C3E9|nr:phosphoribosyl 1,2-cyclic phosphodiesterase [Chitinophagaceae bacterium OAS944]